MSAVLEARGLGRRYGRRQALADCDLEIPQGRVVGLVGPNGAGKSTLLQLACGLIAPSSGTIRVLGARPAADPAHLARVGYVAQDTPVYAGLSVAEHLRMGAALNPGWDAALARRRIEQLGLDPRQKAGRLSGGQRAQLALTVAAAKRPELLIFDEPAAALDPLARRGFLENLMEFVADLGASAILSSHSLADVQRVCDYLIVLADSRVQVAGSVQDLLAAHYRVVGGGGGGGLGGGASTLPDGVEAVGTVGAERLVEGGSLVVRAHRPPPPGDRAFEPVGLEDLVLAYMTRTTTGSATGTAKTSEARR